MQEGLSTLFLARDDRVNRVLKPCTSFGLQAINALPPSAALTFSRGLTVVYGCNGAGKSGFARILSNVCFSRARHQILPNVYKPGAEGVPNANITVICGNQVETRLALAEAREDADLKRIAVFDT